MLKLIVCGCANHRTSLGWFAHVPEWYDTNNTNFAPSEAQSVSVFVQHLLNDRVDPPHLDAKGRGNENGSSLIDTVSLQHLVTI